MTKPFLQYWDSMLFIHRIQRTPEHLVVLDQLAEDAQNGKLNIVVSTFTLAEVIKDPDGQQLSETEDQKIIEFFENPYIIIRPLTYPISLLARKISREFGTKPKDAVHLATAVYWNIPQFFTFEKGLINKDGKLGDPQKPLRISEPKWVGQQSLIEKESNNDDGKETGAVAEAEAGAEAGEV